jgi:hypothetical protein
MTGLVIAVLGLWLLVSIANQFRGPWGRFLDHLNAYSLLPRLEFFAPDPIDVDYHLAYRDFTADGQPGPWKQIAIERDGPSRLVWSTAKRDHQAMLGAVSGLAVMQQHVAPLVPDPSAVLQISLPYLFLLHQVQQAPRAVTTTHRQFMVVEAIGFGSSRRLSLGILSNPHELT